MIRIKIVMKLIYLKCMQILKYDLLLKGLQNIEKKNVKIILKICIKWV